MHFVIYLELVHLGFSDVKNKNPEKRPDFHWKILKYFTVWELFNVISFLYTADLVHALHIALKAGEGGSGTPSQAPPLAVQRGNRSSDAHSLN